MNELEARVENDDIDELEALFEGVTYFTVVGPKGDPGAAGKDGHSPVVAATKSGKTTTISVDGAAIATVEDGKPGEKGADGAPGIYYGTTQPTGDTHPVWIDPDGDPSESDLSLGLTNASVGQIAKITAVDESGRPTAWSPVDMPTGGGELTWEKIADVTIEDETAHIEQQLPAGLKKLLVIGDPQAKALLSATAKIRLASTPTGYNPEYFAESPGNLNGTWVGFFALVDFTIADKPFALTWQGVNTIAMQASAQYINIFRGAVPPTKMYITTPNGATAFNASKWHIWGAK